MLCSPRGERSDRGFTLIELVVVMSIIAIAFFAARPAFQGALQSAERRAALRGLVSLLTTARTEAVESGILVRVVCDPEEGLLWAEEQVEPEIDRSHFEPLRGQAGKGLYLPEGFSVTQLEIGGMDAQQLTKTEMYCYPDGSTDGLLLAIEDTRGREAVIEMLPATGKVVLGE